MIWKITIIAILCHEGQVAQKGESTSKGVEVLQKRVPQKVDKYIKKVGGTSKEWRYFRRGKSTSERWKVLRRGRYLRRKRYFRKGRGTTEEEQGYLKGRFTQEIR